MAVESVNQTQSLYFAAVQTAKQEAAKAEKKRKTDKLKAKIFSSALQKSQEEHELLSAGLPKEIAGMTTEEAVIYLKDAADIAAETLKSNQIPQNFTDYRKKVSQFMRFVVKNNIEIKHKMKYRANTKRHLRLSPYVQVSIINQKLDEMAKWLISSHRDTLKMLARIDEINGLLVDLLAT
jgi:uncharacterized protein YaaR (DUF327 family)